MKAGKYRARAAAVEFACTNNGNEYVQVSFEVGGQLEPWKGYLNSDDNIKRTLHALRLMGWKGSDLESITIADLPGWVQVDAREDRDKDTKAVKLDDNGEPIVRIAFVNSLSGLRDAPMPADKRKALSLRLRGAIAAARVCEPVLEGPPAMPGDDAAPGKDDLPF